MTLYLCAKSPRVPISVKFYAPVRPQIELCFPLTGNVFRRQGLARFTGQLAQLQQEQSEHSIQSRGYDIGGSGGSRKLGTGGGGGGGGAQRGRLRQNQVLAVCTERSTGISPPLPYRYGSERAGGGAPGTRPPLNPCLGGGTGSRHVSLYICRPRPLMNTFVSFFC